jgi:hypothetical protein
MQVREPIIHSQKLPMDAGGLFLNGGSLASNFSDKIT